MSSYCLPVSVEVIGHDVDEVKVSVGFLLNSKCKMGFCVI